MNKGTRTYPPYKFRLLSGATAPRKPTSQTNKKRNRFKISTERNTGARALMLLHESERKKQRAQTKNPDLLLLHTVYIGKQSSPRKSCGCYVVGDMDINCLACWEPDAFICLMVRLLFLDRSLALLDIRYISCVGDVLRSPRHTCCGADSGVSD